MSSARGETRIEEATRAERTIARRAAEARATVPDLELSTDVAGAVGGVAQVVAAAAAALREHPRANATYRDGNFELHDRVNVGVSTPGAEAFPTIFDADRKTVDEIAEELKRLESRALAGELTSAELSGATFTISDFGAYGIDRATAVIAPSNAAALAVGAARAVPIIRDGVIVPGTQMTLTLACDHRILFGAEAAGFLRRIADLIQGP